MKIISTKVHAVLDYLFVLVLFLAPRLFKLMDPPEAENPAVWMGPSIAAMLLASISVITNYEGGLYKWIPMRGHLYFDIVLGLLLAGSPWLFGFAKFVYLPHLLLGAGMVVGGLITSKSPPEPYTQTRRKPFSYEIGES